MSVCFTCLCNSTHRRPTGASAVYQNVSSFFLGNWLLSLAMNLIALMLTLSMLTRNYSVTRPSSTSGTECHKFWLERMSSYTRDCLWISWRLMPLSALGVSAIMRYINRRFTYLLTYSQAYVERLVSLCGDLTARKRDRTRASLYRQVFLKLNPHILHWTYCTVNWSVTCFWYCRTAEDMLRRLRFWLLLTYLVLSLVVHINIQECQNQNENPAKTVTKTKTKMIHKTKKTLDTSLVGSTW